MECVTSLNLTNGSTAGNGILCGFAPVVTPCNKRRIVGRDVSYGVRPEAYHEDQRVKRISLENCIESAISVWKTDPLEVVGDSRHWRRCGRLRSPNCCKPLCSNVELVV
jgi:hypothetical protein